MQHLNRKQNKNDVLFGDAQSGAVKTVYTDQDDAWLDVVDDWQWLNAGQQFTWIGIAFGEDTLFVALWF